MAAQPISGFILAGGSSRRMGKDKAQIAWGDGSLVTDAVRRMRQVVAQVSVVGLSGDSPVEVVEDIFPGQGPLAGLHAALVHSVTDWNLVLAVDMPLVTVPLLQFIAAQCDEKFLAVVTRTTKAGHSQAPGASRQVRLQPLCAAYHRMLLPVIERALSSHELSIHRLFERLQEGIMNEQSRALRVIEEDELAEAGFSDAMLLNVNTPADLERARALANK